MNVYELMEEILNTLDERKYSDEEMKEIANKVYDKRAEKFHKEVNKLDKITGDTNPDEFTNVQQHRANKQAEKVERAQDRLQHAEEVAKLPKKDALRRFFAADKANEALEIMEEIINEVSLRKWKEAAKNSIEGREKEAAKSLEITDKGWQEYEKEARKHPEDEPQLFKLAQANDAAAYKDKERAEHAAKVAYAAPDSKHSANKFLKAAHNAEEFHMDKADYRKPAYKDKHYIKAVDAGHKASMDPVKSRIKEAFELMEEILFELDSEQKQNISPNKIKKTKKDENGEKVEVVSVADELFPYEGDAKQQFNQKILAKINDMIEGVGSLEDLIQFVRRGVQAKKVAHESIQEGKPKDPKGYKENMDIANHYDHLYSNEPAKAPDGSPNSVAAEWNRRYQEYFDKAMKCYYGDCKKGKKVAEALSAIKEVTNTILERKNIFGHEEGNRGDLIDDVSKTVTGNTLHQHIENAANKVVKPVKPEDKIKKVGEAFELMEEILSETSYGRKMELLRKREENAEQANVNAFKDLIRGYVVGVTPEEKAKAEKDFAASQAKNLEAQGKLNKARRLVQNSGKKKVNEALDMMEEIINEVSVKKWKETAAKVLPKRIEDRNKAYDKEEKLEKIDRKERNEKYVTPDGKTDDEKYRNSSAFKNYMNSLHDSIKAGNRVAHASAVSKLPDSKVSAQKLRRAADKSTDTRERQWSDIESSGCGGKEWTKKVTRAADRMEKAGDLARRDTIVHTPGKPQGRY